MFPFFTEQAKAKGMILFFSKFFSSVFECQEVNPVVALVSRPTKIVKTHFTIMATAVVATAWPGLLPCIASGGSRNCRYIAKSLPIVLLHSSK